MWKLMKFVRVLEWQRDQYDGDDALVR
jgi:hypothetical protein